ncbi:MAG: S9 family peptidase [Bacillota bacterium]
MSKINLEEILAVKYLGAWDWSPDGRWISYLWSDGGLVDCWLVPTAGGEAKRLTQAKNKVAAAAWNRRSGALALVVDGDLYLAEQADGWFSLRRVTASGDIGATLVWSNDGESLLLSMGGGFYLLQGELWRKLKFSGKPQTAVWSPDSQRLLIRFTDPDYRDKLLLATREGTVLWYSDNSQAGVSDAQWLDEGRFVYQVSKDISRVHDWYLATLPTDGEWADYTGVGEQLKLRPTITHLYQERQEDRRGALRFSGVMPSPGGQHLLFRLELDGWVHFYRYDLDSRQMQQLTRGQCEDLGHATDLPAWAPEGQRFTYSSNRDDLIRRDLWVYDMTTGKQEKVTDFPVTNLQPKWSPDGCRIAFVHCDQYLAPDIWVLDLEQGEQRQLTNSMPPCLAEKLQAQEQVTFKGAQDWHIDGFLLKPKDFDPNKKYPALVWVHGGPIRQLRGSWHPSYSYAHFYAVNQYLASQGYVTLSLNYRGGIGYGKGFRFGLYQKMGVDDVVDVVSAGRFLKSLPYVDENKVGVYGLSYGGYMTLHCLTQYPEEFAIGINFAGIWDFAQWTRWIESRGRRGGTQFACYFCGMPDDAPEYYAQGSPVTFRENLCKPLINFHGTKDANVDFEQLDRIVEDCVRLGKTYEAYYYPNEVHMFAHRRTWRDVLPKMERELEKYLK